MEQRHDTEGAEESDDEIDSPCGSAAQKKEMILIQKATKTDSCVKCHKAAGSLLWRKDICCWPCFSTIVSKRFKSTFTKIREHKRETVRLLIAFSGGSSSRALLHNVSECTKGRGVKDFFDVQVVFVDEASMFGAADFEDQDTLDALHSIVKGYGFRLHILPLAGVYSDSGEVKEEHIQRLRNAFQAISSHTAREDMRVYLRTLLLVQAATKIGAHKILTGDSATHFAIHMIASTCKGRGFGLADELQLTDSRFQSAGVLFLRPMKDFLAKEIALFNHYHHLQTVLTAQASARVPAKSSINGMSEDFLAGLQYDFPHTIHTLLRCGDKLSQACTAEAHLCPLCASPLTVEELKQPQVELTKCASTAEVSTDSQSCGTGDCGCKGTSLRSMGNTELVLCYACTRLLAETSSSSVLPATVLVRGARLRNSAQLRSQIEEYLLE